MKNLGRCAALVVIRVSPMCFPRSNCYLYDFFAAITDISGHVALQCSTLRMMLLADTPYSTPSLR